MVLWLCAHLPLLPLDALRPGPLNALPMLVWQEERGRRSVLAVNPAAREAGLTPGLHLASAQALVPQALVRTREPAREAEFLRQLALALGQLTPHLSLQAPDVLMEVGSCLRLFGGVRRLQHLARTIAADCGAQVGWGLASTPLAARLFARGPDAAATTSPHPLPTGPSIGTATAAAGRSGARCLRLASTRRRLQALPLARLGLLAGLDETGLSLFQHLGVQRLAELQALPRAGLARRGAQAWLDALDRARGERPDPQPWYIPPEQFDTDLELLERSDQADTLAAGADQLLQPLAGWLALRWQAAQRLRLVLQHERRLHAATRACAADAPGETTVQLDLAVPSRDAAHLGTLLRERLQRQGLPAPVYRLRLVLDLATSHAGEPGSLVPDERERQRDLGTLIERLQARLGAERVCKLQPVDDARPECADRPVPAASHPTPAAARPAPPRPTWLLREPQALRDNDGQPLDETGRQRLRLLGRPERIESGWFDGHLVRRDYHVALGDDGVLRWVYQERGGAIDESPRWFLHGLFA